jgi:aspartyl/glutamyl-tRNA(Asn/Gln) amidotransferase C subunit
MPKITKSELKKIAKIAKIKITDQEAKKFTKDLKNITKLTDALLASRISELAQTYSSSLEFTRGGKEKTTRMYSYIHDCCE